MSTLVEDLRKLRKLKEHAEAIGRKKKTADAEFKDFQKQCMDRMEKEGVAGMRDADTGTLFTLTPKDKFNVSDRGAFVDWALATDPELVEYRERSQLLNALGREHLDNGQPLPPGVDHFPDPYISQRKG